MEIVNRLPFDIQEKIFLILHKSLMINVFDELMIKIYNNVVWNIKDIELDDIIINKPRNSYITNYNFKSPLSYLFKYQKKYYYYISLLFKDYDILTFREIYNLLSHKLKDVESSKLKSIIDYKYYFVEIDDDYMFITIEIAYDIIDSNFNLTKTFHLPKSLIHPFAIENHYYFKENHYFHRNNKIDYKLIQDYIRKYGDIFLTIEQIIDMFNNE